jgi:hypothetical protein
LVATSQVRYWLDFVGLSQHRYKFSHHAVDGRTLIKLTDEALYKLIGIHSLGQRRQLLECIHDLKECIDFSGSPPRERRGSAPPFDIKEHIARLQRDLDKARHRAGQQQR